MAIKGSLKEASLPDVLQLLTMGGKSGCLSVTDRTSFGYIYFDAGRIIYASLLNRRDRLGDILVREGAVSREQLDEAIEEQSRARDGRRLGEILNDGGLIDEETLHHYVKHQIEEAVYHLFAWSQGTFYFEPGHRPERETILVSIDPESLLLEGARRVDEWSQIEKKIPSLDLIFTLDSDRASSLSSLDLTPVEERILPYLKGKHSAWDVIEETALPEFEVGKAIYGLITAGLVRRTGSRQRADKSAKETNLYERRNLGVAFYRASMFDEAVRELKHVLELDPEALDAEFYLGLIALRQDNPEGAARQFRALLKRGAANAAVYNNLALALVSQGKSSEALRIVEEGLEKSGGHPKLCLSKAVLHLKLGDPAAAKSALESYRELADGAQYSALYYSTLAIADAMSADLDSAVAVIEDGVAQHSASAALSNNAGVIFERKGDEEKARELYERAFECDAGLPQASKNLGDLLYRAGNYENAAAIYERALLSDPDLGDDIYAKLGNVYYKRRERDRAIEMWVRALDLNPNNEVVRTNLEFVKGAAGES